MEKTTETLWTSQRVEFTDQNLKISLNIDKNKYSIPLSSLFRIAARENTKRSFLFVSRVLGKHIPIKPNTMKIIGGLLSRLWLADNYNIHTGDTQLLVKALLELLDGPSSSGYEYVEEALKALSEPVRLREKTLFIGFAETATGIAQAVFNNFENASYIHTTREKITALLPNFIFKEEHSHAVDHSLYSLNPRFLEGYDRIVLIDDELTTGNTALNLMKNLPSKSFGIITILDWRSEEQLLKFNSLQDMKVKVCSLIKGTIGSAAIIKPYEKADDYRVEIEQNSIIAHQDIEILSTGVIEGYSAFTGRFGIDSSINPKINTEIHKAAEVIKKLRIPGNCLCLGTEEFIYVPCMIGAELGDNVYFHSTTRSPVYSKKDEAYCIKNKVQFTSPNGDEIKNYIYNIPKNFYTQVFLFTEKPLGNSKKDMFKDIFNTFNIKNITFVCFKQQ